MNQNPNLTPESIDKLLAVAGAKLGTDPKKLRAQFEQGAFDDVLRRLPKGKSEMVSNLMQNPKAMEQMLNTPQAQQLLRNLMGGK